MNIKEIDFKPILEKAKNKDEQSIRELVECTKGYVGFVARSITGSNEAAQDVSQEYYIKLFQNINSINEQSFLAWTNTVIRNCAYDYLRKNNKLNEYGEKASFVNYDEAVYTKEDEKIESQPDKVFEQQERQRFILEIIDSLPLEQREVIISYFYQEKKIKEIAKELNISENTVKSRLAYAKKHIAQKVEELHRNHGIKLYDVAPIGFFIGILASSRKSHSSTVSSLMNSSPKTSFASSPNLKIENNSTSFEQDVETNINEINPEQPDSALDDEELKTDEIEETESDNLDDADDLNQDNQNDLDNPSQDNIDDTEPEEDLGESDLEETDNEDNLDSNNQDDLDNPSSDNPDETKLNNNDESTDSDSEDSENTDPDTDDQDDLDNPSSDNLDETDDPNSEVEDDSEDLEDPSPDESDDSNDSDASDQEDFNNPNPSTSPESEYVDVISDNQDIPNPPTPEPSTPTIQPEPQIQPAQSIPPKPITPSIPPSGSGHVAAKAARAVGRHVGRRIFITIVIVGTIGGGGFIAYKKGLLAKIPFISQFFEKKALVCKLPIDDPRMDGLTLETYTKNNKITKMKYLLVGENDVGSSGNALVNGLLSGASNFMPGIKMSSKELPNNMMQISAEIDVNKVTDMSLNLLETLGIFSQSEIEEIKQSIGNIQAIKETHENMGFNCYYLD